MTQIDILYIHPLGQNPSFSEKYFNKENKNNAQHFFGFIPMGIIGIINNLIKNNITVKGVNLALKKRVNPSFTLKDCLNHYKPKIILIDMHWYVHIKNGIEIAKECKELQDCKVIAGGLSATFFYKELLKIPDIDYISKGDSEKPLLELTKAILNNKPAEDIENIASKEFDNEIKYICADIDNYNYINLDFLEDKESYLNMFDSWLLVGKGCPFDCKNCDGARDKTEGLFGRNRTLFRKPEIIIKDLKEIESETVGFSLDLQIMPDEIIQKLSKEHFNLNLRNEFFQIPQDTNKIKKIKNSFNSFDFVFSPVSGDDKERKEYGKNFTNKDFLEILKEVDKKDVNSGMIIYFSDYMISPLETKELNKKAREKLIEDIDKVIPYALIKTLPQIVDPGTLKDKIPIEKLFKLYSQ